jgi:CheY-like chemotaxis protein
MFLEASAMTNEERAARLDRIAAETKLLDALMSAKDVIKTWHRIYAERICSPAVTPARAWEVYDRESPEMQKINAVIAEGQLLLHQDFPAVCEAPPSVIHSNPSLRYNRSANANQEQMTTAMLAAGSNPNIIYASDGEHLGMLMVKVLEQNSYRALQVRGQKLMQKLAHHPPDLVILDFTLSQNQRLELSEQLKKTAPEVPVLILHARGALDNPFVDYAVDSREGTSQVLQAVSMLLLTRRARSHRHSEIPGEYLIFAERNRRIVEITEKTCDLLGYPRPFLIGQTVEEISAIPSRDVENMFTAFLDEGRMEGQYLLRHRCGDPVKVSFIARAFEDGCLISSLTPHGTLSDQPASA